ncbi:hypothetical protein HDE_01471 [Halotydeus destructor]|nr:hypothetical protein HDE_01471 [Halotydeus destructor]
MTVFATAFLRLKRIFLTILGMLRRAMCCRKRRNSDSLLPVTVESTKQAPDHRQISSNYSSSSTSWQAYNQPSYNQPNYVTPNFSQASSGQFEKSAQAPFADGGRTLVPSGQDNKRDSIQDDEDQEPDFFTDMAPKIKKQKKVLLANGRDSNSPHSTVNKFGVDVIATIPASSELGTIDDTLGPTTGDGWGEEPLDIDQSIREARETERLRRLAEHKRLRESKEKEKRTRLKSSASKLS